MKLQDRMDAFKKEMQANAPKEALAIMHSATEELRNSGILNNVVKIGNKAPEFRLENESGTLVSLDGRLSRGPLVLTFYRGKW